MRYNTPLSIFKKIFGFELGKQEWTDFFGGFSVDV